MNWGSIFHWALDTVKDQAQQAAIQEIQMAANSLNKAVATHAPDVQSAVQKALADAAAHAVSGVLTRK